MIALSACNATNQIHVYEDESIESDYNGDAFTARVVELQDYSEKKDMLEIHEGRTLLLLTLEIETHDSSELTTGRNFYNGIQVEWEEEYQGDLYNVEAEPFIDDLKEVTGGEHFIEIEEMFLGPSEKTTIDLPYRIGDDHENFYIRIHASDQVFHFAVEDLVNAT